MIDDPVKQAIEELQELVRCRCLPAYTVRKLRDPECDCDSAEDVKVVVDRIEELEDRMEMAVYLLTEAMVSLREGKIKQRRNRADIIDQALSQWRIE